MLQPKYDEGYIRLNGGLVSLNDTKQTRNWVRVSYLHSKLPILYSLKNELGVLELPRMLGRVNLQVMWIVRKLIPAGLVLRNKHLINVLIIKEVNFYRYVRHFFGYPSHGQRTWSNAKGPKRLNKQIRSAYIESHFKQFSFKCSQTIMNRVAHAEFLNELWYHEWNHEWTATRDFRLSQMRLYRHRKWKIGLSYSLKNKPISFYKNEYKLKRMRGKKKIVQPKGIYNIGLPLNFSKVYYKKLFSKSLWEKKKKMLL